MRGRLSHSSRLDVIPVFGNVFVGWKDVLTFSWHNVTQEESQSDSFRKPLDSEPCKLPGSLLERLDNMQHFGV